MKTLIHKFFTAYLIAFYPRTVFIKDSPKEMMQSPVDTEGWFEWKLIKGTFDVNEYDKVEKEFNIKFPKAFIEWHKEYFFLDADTSILRLPISNPNLPLRELRSNLNWFIAEQLIQQKIYPFGEEGNDAGPLVFDGRKEIIDNNFPIRFYDNEFGGDLQGLSEIIFSSFEKLLKCLVHFMTELKTRKNYEIIPDFFVIDRDGAGSTGLDYWMSWVQILKANSEEFEK